MAMQVGFVGLGAMGTAIATNLVKAGYAVKAWNRSKIDELNGLQQVADPVDALQTEVAFTMLSDDAAIREVLLDSGALSKAKAGLVHVVMSTISIAFVHELAHMHKQAGLGYVAAPVLGRPDVAAKGELNVLAGGDAQKIEQVRPLLEAIGKKVWIMGDAPAQANAAKIAANMMITMVIESLAEAVVITESHHLERAKFFDLILNTLFSGRTYDSYSDHIRTDQYDPGFKASLGLKDLGLAALATPKELPMLNAVHSRMQETVDAGLGGRDWSAMASFTIRQALGEG